MDFPKAYDCIPHDLLIAKLEAYRLDKIPLNFLLDYLSIRKQRIKIGSAYSEWVEILSGIPQNSILGPLLFDICTNDLFFFVREYAILLMTIRYIPVVKQIYYTILSTIYKIF